MTSQMYWKIRNKLQAEGIWMLLQNTQIYTTEQVIEEYGHQMSEDLKSLLRTHVNRIQRYLDDRILEPK